MPSKLVTVLMLMVLIVICDAESQATESRGKKKKLAMFVYFADLVVKKIFILKLAYAFIFWVLIHKAGYFLTWFASYLKEQKHHQHEHHDYHGPPHDYEPSYAPYRRQGGLI